MKVVAFKFSFHFFSPQPQISSAVYVCVCVSVVNICPDVCLPCLPLGVASGFAQDQLPLLDAAEGETPCMASCLPACMVGCLCL